MRRKSIYLERLDRYIRWNTKTTEGSDILETRTQIACMPKKRRYALHSKHEKTGEALMYLIFRTNSIKRDNDPWPVWLSGRGLAFTRKGERVEGSVPGQ